MARLIDADEFMKEIRKWLGNETDFRSLQEVIAGMPTIDPVKHGKWEFGKSHEEFVEAECTACGGMLLVKWYDKLSEYNYCPRCGADMRGE